MEAVFKRVAERAAFYVSVLLSRRSIATFGLSSLGVGVYYFVSWDAVGVLLAKLVSVTLELAGYSALREGNCIALAGVRICIEDECTHMCLILAAIPFIWRGKRLVCEILRVLTFVVAFQAGNVARICWTMVLLSDGVAWEYAHDLVAHLFRNAVDVLIILLWVGAMTRSFTGEGASQGQPSN